LQLEQPSIGIEDFLAQRRVAGHTIYVSVLFEVSVLCGFWSEWGRVGPLGGGRGSGPGFGAGRERLGPSCSDDGILKKSYYDDHAQTTSGSSVSLIVMWFCVVLSKKPSFSLLGNTSLHHSVR
jgi:hypothetical protein